MGRNTEIINNQKPSVEISKKLYRTISEQIQRIDEARTRARSISDLFTPLVQIQRKKLCDYCERLIFSDPVAYGRKGEELLWRKTFYDVISTAKKLKKTSKDFSTDEIGSIQAHLNVGTGFYYHFISKLQKEYNLNLKSIVDFTDVDSADVNLYDRSNIDTELIKWAEQAVHQCLIYLGDLNRYKLEIYPNWSATLAIRHYRQAIAYKPDFGMPYNQIGTLAMARNHHLDALYHYLRCLSCKIPFEGTQNNLRNLLDKNTIDDVGVNDTDDVIIEFSRTENVQRFISRFFLLIDTWYFDKNVASINIQLLCTETYTILEAIIESNVIDIDNNSGTNDDDDNSDMFLFKVISICLVCVAKLSKKTDTNSIESKSTDTVITFMLSIYLLVMRYTVTHLKQAILNCPKSTKNYCATTSLVKEIMSNGIINRKMSKLNVLRRRRKLSNRDFENCDDIDSKSLSDLSEDSDFDDSSKEDDDDNSIMSSDDEVEDGLAAETSSSSSDDEDNQGSEAEILKHNDATKDNKLTSKNTMESLENSKNTNESLVSDEGIFENIENTEPKTMLDILVRFKWSMSAIKLIHDWVIATNRLDSLAYASKPLVDLMNIMNIAGISPKCSDLSDVSVKIGELFKRAHRIPLSEDVLLKGVKILKQKKNGDPIDNMDWTYFLARNHTNLTLNCETIVRAINLIRFGKQLVGIKGSGIGYDSIKSRFVVVSGGLSDSNIPAKENGINSNSSEIGVAPPPKQRKPHQNGKKMQHMMGQLWLASEVNALENRLGPPATLLSPYLIVDAEALTKYRHMVKNLVFSRKFIVIVPISVVSALDDLKRDKPEARDAIRWLEMQFHRGNRFLRAQRPHEAAPLPSMIRTAKKQAKTTKKVQIPHEIIECCNYLMLQQRGNGSGGGNDAFATTTTLLVGDNDIISSTGAGLARSVGVAVETVVNFHARWRSNNSKSGSRRRGIV